MKDMTKKVIKIIDSVFDSLTCNNLAAIGNADAQAWERPITGIAAGDNEYYDLLHKNTDGAHLLPQEIFSLKYDDKSQNSHLCVISLIFPIPEETRQAQSKARDFPSESWIATSEIWTKLIKEFGSKAEAELAKHGIRSVATDLLNDVITENSAGADASLTWSHRHSAFAAGLGTFGLSEAFISERGTAIGITSLVAEAELDFTGIEEREEYDWCLYYNAGICGSCIRRCPVRAISEKGLDKDKCEAYRLKSSGCGLCRSKVPCMEKRP